MPEDNYPNFVRIVRNLRQRGYESYGITKNDTIVQEDEESKGVELSPENHDNNGAE